jgi:proteasome accessory factor C
MIGVPPYTGGCGIEITLDEDEGFVEAFPQPYLTRPPRLSTAQGFALLASAQGLLEFPHERGGPLASAVAKLAKVLGDPDVVDVDLQSPANLEEVRIAAERGERLQVVYYSAWRDEEHERDIEPHVVFQRHGRWYVEAWCHLANDKRRFRVDRMRSLRPTGEMFTPIRSERPAEVWDPGPEAERVVVDIPVSARWVTEAYPVEWEAHEGMLRVTMNVLGTAWLERVLLKVGPDARVVEPESMRSLGADAARRLLEAY